MDVAEQHRRARAAFAAGDWAAARAGLRRARDLTELDPQDLGCLAMCEWWLGDAPAAISLSERAFQGWIDRGEVEAAARGALDLGLISYTTGDVGLGAAWFGRARRVLAGREHCAGYGYLLYAAAVSRLELDGQMRGGPGSLPQAAARLAALAQEVPDPAVRTFATVVAGMSTVFAGQVRDGFDLLDEAMLTVVGGGLPPLWAGDVYCGVLHLCETMGDVARMRRWTSAMESWAAPLSRTFTYYGVSRIHRLQLSSAEGDWDLVEHELADRSERLAPAHGWVAGEGFRELGDIHRMRGDHLAARRAYARAQQLGIDPQPGLALLLAAQGRAAAGLEQVHATLSTRQLFESSRILLAGVQIALQAGAQEDAQRFGRELTEVATQYDTPGLYARNEHARGLLALAAGHPHAAIGHLTTALETYRDQRFRYGIAVVHGLLARAQQASGNPQAARADRATAHAVYRSLGAVPDTAPPSGRSSTPGGLTVREAQVLAAISAGATNRQVAADLVISEKTVGRHLANIYQKLNVTSRTAAAHWAHTHGIGS